MLEDLGENQKLWGQPQFSQDFLKQVPKYELGACEKRRSPMCLPSPYHLAESQAWALLTRARGIVPRNAHCPWHLLSPVS